MLRRVFDFVFTAIVNVFKPVFADTPRDDVLGRFAHPTPCATLALCEKTGETSVFVEPVQFVKITTNARRQPHPDSGRETMLRNSSCKHQKSISDFKPIGRCIRR